MALQTYVELRVFTHDPEAPYVPASGATIDQLASSFVVAANATAVYEKCRKVFARALHTGIAEMTERFAPGPKSAPTGAPASPPPGFAAAHEHGSSGFAAVEE